MNHPQFVPSRDLETLATRVQAAKTASLGLTLDMMDALSDPAKQMLVGLQDAAWRIGLEITADVYGTPRLCLIAVSPTGERRVVMTVAESGKEGSH